MGTVASPGLRIPASIALPKLRGFGVVRELMISVFIGVEDSATNPDLFIYIYIYTYFFIEYPKPK